MNRIPPEALHTPIEGVNLNGRTLSAQLSSPFTLLVFLRHYGCIFCKELVRDLKLARQRDKNYPPILFFGQGDLSQTIAFAAKLWPDMSIVSDPAHRFYDAMGLDRGSIYQMFGPRVWACGVRAGLKLNFQSLPVGDIWAMPGAFAVDASGTILWSHKFDHIADHPNWGSLPSLVAAQMAPQAPAKVNPALLPLAT